MRIDRLSTRTALLAALPVAALVGCAPIVVPQQAPTSSVGDARDARGDGDGADDGDGEADGGGEADLTAASCFAAWADPLVLTDAARPDPAAFPAMRAVIEYAIVDGRARMVLERLEGELVVGAADGPFSIEANSGAWIELRDAADQPRYTRGEFVLVPESMEAPAGGGGFTNATVCPEEGQVRLTNLPNDASTTSLVLFQQRVDGDPAGPTIELARFPLP